MTIIRKLTILCIDVVDNFSEKRVKSVSSIDRKVTCPVFVGESREHRK